MGLPLSSTFEADTRPVSLEIRREHAVLVRVRPCGQR